MPRRRESRICVSKRTLSYRGRYAARRYYQPGTGKHGSSFKSRHPPHASLTFYFSLLRPQASDKSDVRGQKRLTTGNFRPLSSSFFFTSNKYESLHRKRSHTTFDNICLTSPAASPVPVSADDKVQVSTAGIQIVKIHLRGNENQGYIPGSIFLHKRRD